MKTKKFEVIEDGETFEGYCAMKDGVMGKLPTVMVFHDWSGRNDFACQKAESLAELGYIGVAVDLYGKGKIGKTTEEKLQLMSPLKDNRTLLKKRLLTWFQEVSSLEHVNTAKMAAIGFCFGGLCALDLARAGAPLKGVVSFHGLLNAPTQTPPDQLQAKILVLHGYDDPMAPPEEVQAFEKEMSAVNADWQVNVYSNTQHAFMNPTAHDEKLGTVYNKLTEKRAFSAMEIFLNEVLS